MHKEPATSVSGNIINLQLSPDSESFPVTRSKQQASVFKLLRYLRPQPVQGYFSNGKPCWKSIIWWITPEWNQSIQKRSGYIQARRLHTNYLSCSCSDAGACVWQSPIFQILHLQLNWSLHGSHSLWMNRDNLNEETWSRTQKEKKKLCAVFSIRRIEETSIKYARRGLGSPMMGFVVCKIWKIFQVSIWMME